MYCKTKRPSLEDDNPPAQQEEARPAVVGTSKVVAKPPIGVQQQPVHASTEASVQPVQPPKNMPNNVAARYAPYNYNEQPFRPNYVTDAVGNPVGQYYTSSNPSFVQGYQNLANSVDPRQMAQPQGNVLVHAKAYGANNLNSNANGYGYYNSTNASNIPCVLNPSFNGRTAGGIRNGYS